MSLSRILVVDDSPSSVEVLSIFFELEGYEVATAANGEEGVSKIQEFEPDLVLMDLRMPIKDGYEAAREIRALPGNENVILVALSGGDMERDRETILDAGFNRVLAKPVSPDEIRELLAEY